MSTLLIEVKKIDQVLPHPNADKLEVAKIGGWQVVVGKGNHQPGDLIIFVPVDSMVPKDLAVKWGVDKYLSWRHSDTMGRTKAARLRGVPSYGFTAKIEEGMVEGQDVKEHYGITKYEPPEPVFNVKHGNQVAKRYQHPLFHKYVDVENLRNYPNDLDYSTQLVVLEKIHGMNSRIGYVPNDKNQYEWVVGSRQSQRNIDDGIFSLPLNKYRDKLEALAKEFLDYIRGEQYLSEIKTEDIYFIIYGEIFGKGIQDLTYNQEEQDWRIFDIMVNGEYLAFQHVQNLCNRHGLPLIPVLAGPLNQGEHFNWAYLEKLAEGNSTFADHIREGIVVRPLYEEKTCGRETDPRRMIFKLISPDYLGRKNGTEYH
jgi:RNA ligase (TIGR02306 family)